MDTLNLELKNIYKPLDSILLDYILPFLILLISGIYIFGYYLKVILLQKNATWSNEKCVPKYMFISGLIQPNEGEGYIRSTLTNFEKCVQSNRSTLTKLDLSNNTVNINGTIQPINKNKIPQLNKKLI